MNDIVILRGADDTLSPDLLTTHIRQARTGQRLLIVDQGGIAAAHADQSHDLTIEAARGNWDIAADCTTRRDRECIAGAFAFSPHFFFSWVATQEIALLLESLSAAEGADLDRLKAAIWATNAVATLDDVEQPLSDLDRVRATALAVLHGTGSQLPARDPALRLVSLSRWHADPRGRVLYLKPGPDDGVGAGVTRAILALADALTGSPGETSTAGGIGTANTEPGPVADHLPPRAIKHPYASLRALLELIRRPWISPPASFAAQVQLGSKAA